MANILYGIHNEEYNIDFYDNGTIEIFNHKEKKTITTFKVDLPFIQTLQKFCNEEMQKYMHLFSKLEINDREFLEEKSFPKTTIKYYAKKVIK